MTQVDPVNPGKVIWTGENPGIYLRETSDGPWVTLSLFGRIILSPKGPGHFMLILDKPDEKVTTPEANNFVITNNPEMFQFILENFIKKFPAFQNRVAFEDIAIHEMTSIKRRGDHSSNYSEIATANGLEVTMNWTQLKQPFAVDVGPDQSADGENQMYSTFVEAGDANINVNGKKLAGNVYPRQFFGRAMSSAFLAFAETWVKPL